MGKCPFLFAIITVIVAACSFGQTTSSTGPRLVQDVPLEPTTPAPQRILSPTPTRIVLTPEQVSPLEVRTVAADFVLVTPTLPPSKTPTQTPTITPTPTQTPTPTVTVTATATALLFPTSVVRRVTAIVPNPLPQICDSTWFFIQPRPASCPLNPPSITQGVFQTFQNGFMLWAQSQDAVYVLYNDGSQPRWQVFKDHFVEGLPESDPAYDTAPAPNTWQPRRGFGMLWRANEPVRLRIGWATQQWEEPYSIQVQTAADGAIFLSEPRGGIFSLLPAGAGWQQYANAGGLFPG